jgi:hypothetical protein
MILELFALTVENMAKFYVGWYVRIELHFATSSHPYGRNKKRPAYHMR